MFCLLVRSFIVIFIQMKIKTRKKLSTSPSNLMFRVSAEIYAAVATKQMESFF